MYLFTLLFAIYPSFLWGAWAYEVFEIMSDRLDTVDNWVIAEDGGVVVTDGATENAPLVYCTDPGRDCVRIRGKHGQDNYIEKQFVFADFPSIDFAQWDSFKMEIDIHMFDLESSHDERDMCLVKVQWGGAGDFTIVHRFHDRVGDSHDDSDQFDEHIPDQIVNFPISQSADNFIIRLETDANTIRTIDYCFWDNFRLSVQKEGDTIWTDDMSDLTDWTQDNAVAVDDYSDTCDEQILGTTDCCTSDSMCVELAGDTPYTGGSITRVTAGINGYNDLLVTYDVHLRWLDEEDGCQLYYKYNNDEPDEFKILASVGGDDVTGDSDDGDVLTLQRTHQINHIPPPLSTEDLSTLSIKFQVMAEFTHDHDDDSADWCYYDDVALKGVPGVAEALEVETDPNDHHIYVIGDFGGDGDEPYVTAEQITNAEMMKSVIYMNQYTIEGIIALGDNFYNDGITTETADERFQETFVDVYQSSSIMSDIPWYPIAGNHDHRRGGDVQLQIDYSDPVISNWHFDHYYYEKTWDFGNDISLQFIGIDSVVACGLYSEQLCEPFYENDADPELAALAEKQWTWVEQTISESTATFILVGAHHSVYSFADHGPAVQFGDRLNPLMDANKCVVAALSGHDHGLQYIEDDGQTRHYMVSGAAHGCSLKTDHLDERNPNANDPLKFSNCNQGGFIRCTVNTEDVSLQCFYYLGTDPEIKFSTGIWTNPTGECAGIVYETVNEVLATDQPTSNPTQTPTMEECYNTMDKNPCTEENIEANNMYFESCSSCCNFIQCDEYSNAFDLPCGKNTYWDQRKLTCAHNYGQCDEECGVHKYY